MASIDTLSPLGELIEERTRDLRISDAELGRRSGVSGQTISNWKRGTTPQGDRVTALAEALDVSQEELIRAIHGERPQGRNGTGDSASSSPATALPGRVAELVRRFGANVPVEEDAFVLTIYHSIRPVAGNPDRFLVEGDEDDAERQLQSKLIFEELLGFWPPDDMRGAYIQGWSMKRHKGGLADGQLVLYRPVTSIDSGRRYVLTIVDLDTGDISPLCKRLQQFVGGGIKIISDNPGAGVEDEVLLPNGNDELINQRTGRHVHIRIAGVVLWPREEDDEHQVRMITRTIEQLAARGLLNP